MRAVARGTAASPAVREGQSQLSMAVYQRFESAVRSDAPARTPAEVIAPLAGSQRRSVRSRGKVLAEVRAHVGRCPRGFAGSRHRSPPRGIPGSTRKQAGLSGSRERSQDATSAATPLTLVCWSDKQTRMGDPNSYQSARKERQFHKVSRSSAYVQVADQLREKILGRAWQAGEPLPAERELADLFGVSRATIREALRHLQAQGLLVARGRTSSLLAASSESAVARFREALTHVVRLGDIPVADLVELRLAVEGAALARAARAPIEAHLEEARNALSIMTDPRVSMRAHRAADVQFHLALVAASGNQGMVSTMSAIRDSIQLRLSEALEKVSHTELRDKITAEHRALLRAVEQGHGARAVEVLRQHLEFYHT